MLIIQINDSQFFFENVLFWQACLISDDAVAHVDALHVVDLANHDVALQLLVDLLQPVVRDGPTHQGLSKTKHYLAGFQLLPLRICKNLSNIIFRYKEITNAKTTYIN